MAPEIRRVSVELLRHGPRHNQLLSPLTSYLAVCGDFPGGVVHPPYEQAEVQNLLDDLRYVVASAEPSDRLSVIRDRAGADLAEMLADIPGLPGVLAGEAADAGALTHLRIVMSAAELALLPFELSKIPVGAGSVGEGWLALQPDRPLCLTRNVRGVSGSMVPWPIRPRILYVSGTDVPFEQHLDALERVLEPWRVEGLQRVDGSDRHWTSPDLTVLREATMEEIRTLVADGRFTHVHVLAHGAEIEERRAVRYGIALGDRVVTGADLALVLSSIGGGARSLPSVVTLASCDSAAQGGVITPGGSVAHDLHSSGIPLVVASQFPISEEASVPFVETFYRGQLSGEHPFVSICEVRRQLATQFSEEHAWASIVVYEALPRDFDVRLEELNYWQNRRAHDVALGRLEAIATSDRERAANLLESGTPFDDDFVSPSAEQYDDLVLGAIEAGEKMPTSGPFGAESDGLRAAGYKRIAEVAFWLALAPDIDHARQDTLFGQCVGGLQAALELYTSTMRAMLGNTDERVHRKVTLHWIVGQVMLMQAILGEDVDEDLGGVVRLTARLDLDDGDPVVRGWANVSLIEQALLQLAVHGPSKETASEAVRCASELLRSLGEDAEHVWTTRRQMRRFATWWGNDRFSTVVGELGATRRHPWDGDDGVVATAGAVVDALTPRSHVESLLRRRLRQPLRPETRVATPAAARAVAPGMLGAPPSEGAQSDESDESEPAPPAPAVERTGTLEIEILPANNGDCLWVSYGDEQATRHMLVDCGAVRVADAAAERVRSVDRVELFILTHIDADHINGAVPLFTTPDVARRFEDVWFNGWNQLRGFLSVAQGEEFSALLERADREFMWNRTEPAHDPPPPIMTDGVSHPIVELQGGLRLTVLSPNRRGLQRLAQSWHAALLDLNPQKAMLGRRARPTPPANPAKLDLEKIAADGPTKDSSVPNLSSIAVLAEFGGRAVLLTGDAHADVLATSIRRLQETRGRAGQRLRLDALKLSHHGSANATTRELLETIECSNYLVPTDGSIFYHPDRSGIARVIVHGGPQPTLYFNYRSDLNAFWEDAALQQKYGYSTVYPDGEEPGIRVTL